jgi:hypothetical protein
MVTNEIPRPPASKAAVTPVEAAKTLSPSRMIVNRP